MKNILQTLCSFLLTIGLWACTPDNSVEKSILKENEITKIEATIEPFEINEGTNTRTSINLGEFGEIGKLVWAEGDTIGIYPSQGDQLSFPIVDGVNETRCEFSGGGWALKASTATVTYTYSAYSPFNRNYYFQKNNTALPVSMLGQKQIGNNSSKHLGAYDIQMAKGETPTSGALIFNFKHQTAYVRMDITAPSKAIWKNITLESNAEFTTKATMNLSLETPSLEPTSKSYTVSLDLEEVDTNDDLHIVAYMMMLPVDFTGKTLTMKLTDIDNNIYSAPVTFVNPISVANYLNFAANKARWIAADNFTLEIDAPPYLTFTANEEQTFSMSQAVSTVEYSVNGGEWSELGTTIVPFGGEYGDLQLRGKNYLGTGTNTNIKFGNVGNVSCKGDIRTLIDYENYATVNTSEAKFGSLFLKCTNLTSSPKLPATTLAESCYENMFNGCTSLVEAPELPATTLAKSCYEYMFSGCASLVEAPELPATTLAESCYRNMFTGCSSLKNAPTLPVMTLTKLCYYGMFAGCSSFIKAPELPATILSEYCYEYMFSNCSSLITAPTLPATTLARSCYGSMFSGCSSLEEAPELPATLLPEWCYDKMFSGCSSLEEAPELPATLLSEYCYQSMFSDCSSLEEAPELPATILSKNCYSYMFSGCENLRIAPVLSATILAQNCYSYMFYGCNNLTVAPELPATTLAKDCYNCMFINCKNLTKAPKLPAKILSEGCYSNMFNGCTSLITAPELPATTLASNCYQLMFNRCTSLITAPKLLATTLAESCYSGMFSECTKLSNVTMLATNINATDCLTDWLHNVASTGTFTKSAKMEDLPEGPNGIPTGWTVINHHFTANESLENPSESETVEW